MRKVSCIFIFVLLGFFCLIPLNVWAITEAVSGFQMPIEHDPNNYGYVFKGWSSTSGSYHPGVDLNGPGYDDDDPVYAVANGVVVYATTESWGGVVIQHLYQGETWYSQYGHVDSIYVSVGEDVHKGQEIAEIGSVGPSTGPHLHFEIRESDHPNPTYGAYWNTTAFQNTSNIEEWYEDPEAFINSHGPYGEPTLAMEYALTKGIINDINTPPSGSVNNKAEFIKMLIAAIENIFGTQSYNSQPYSDVDSNQWYYVPVCKAYALGLLTYDSNHLTFNPADDMLRSWASMVIKKAMKNTELWNFPDPPSNFDDGFFDISHLSFEEQESIRFLNYYGIGRGSQTGAFEPSRGIFRYESCAMLFRLMTIPLSITAPASVSTGESFSVDWSYVNDASGYELNESSTNLFSSNSIYTGTSSYKNFKKYSDGSYYYRSRVKYVNQNYDPDTEYGGWSKYVPVQVGTIADCSDSLEPNETISTAMEIDLNSSISSYICSANDVDWYKVPVNGSGTLTIDLTSLPNDYDLILTDSNISSDVFIYGSRVSSAFQSDIIDMGHNVNISSKFPSDVSRYDAILVMDYVSNQDDTIWDGYVSAGGGLIIFEGAFQYGSVINTTAASNPVSHYETWTNRSGTTVVDTSSPLTSYLGSSSSLTGYTTVPTIKDGANTVIRWNEGEVPMAVTYTYGAGRTVFLNDFWAWYNNNWRGDYEYGLQLMSNALNYVTQSDDATFVISSNGGTSSEQIVYSDSDMNGYYYIMVFGKDGANNASDPYNLNVTWSSNESADLTLSGGSINATTVCPGDTIDVGITVKNQGTGTAEAGYINYYFNDSRFYTDPYKIGSDYYGSLSTGWTSPESISYTIPSDTAPGTYYFYFWIDATETEAESNEDNNRYQWDITVESCSTPSPDLAVLNPSVSPQTVKPGDTVSVSCSVKNQGDGTTGASSTLKYYLSTDSTYSSDDTYLNVYDGVSTLSAGASENETASLTIPSSTNTGDWYILFVSDATDNITESNENNNTAYKQIQVGTSACSPNWTPVNYTNSTTVYAEVSIKGQPAAAGDIVGAFDSSGQCRATATVFELSGQAHVTLVIQGESKETIYLKVYDVSGCEEFNANSIQTAPGTSIGTPPNYFNIQANVCEETNTWIPTTLTNSATLYGVVTIDEQPATEGDIVGAFVEGECRGVGTVFMLDGTAYVTLVVQQEQEETVQFKICHVSTCEIFDAGTKQTAPGHTYSDVPIEYTPEITQSLSLNSGWNLISMCVVPEDMTPSSVFAPILSNLVQVKSVNKSYDPNVVPQFNTLTELECGKGYWVKVSQDIQLDVTGMPADCTTIALSSGWNLVGYPFCQGPQDVETALSSIMAVLEQAKSTNQSYDPDVAPQFNTLKEFEPGKGYWVNVTDPTSLNYTAPTARDGRDSFKLVDRSRPDWEPVNYTNSTTVYVEVTIDGDPAADGDLVGAFASDEECRVLGEVFTLDGSAYATLVIQGEVSESVSFKVYDASRDVILEIDSSYNVQTDPGNTIGDPANNDYVLIAASAPGTSGPGDVDHMENVNLKDAILVLKVLTGMDGVEVFSDADVNNDERIGIQEAIYILQVVSGLRNG